MIPARDEAETLAKTLEALQSIRSLSRIFVVDDGSRDATAEIARTLGAEVLPASPPGKNRGKGHALRAGLALVRELSPDAFLLADADLGPSAGRLSHLIDALDEDHPAVVAAFPPSAGPAAPAGGEAPTRPSSAAAATAATATQARNVG